MTTRKLRGSALALLSAALVSMAPLPGLAQSVDDTNGRLDMLFGDHARFEAAFEALQGAVKAHDAATVASLVKYPFRTEIAGKIKVLHNDTEFVQNYDAIFSPEITAAVLGQSYAELFANGDGVMLGNGQVWLGPICLDNACGNFYWTIITIQSAQ